MSNVLVQAKLEAMLLEFRESLMVPNAGFGPLCQVAKFTHKTSKTKTKIGCIMVFGLLYFMKLIKALENVLVSSISFTKCST
jgi:hypothetical protein